ncbi:MAG: phytanoyl-CoA dioxygenase family protein [Ilumatobacteraceae bacterium]|nr:phytanoyl-CoA dioxygenase family protein [Ilumatobacteraceae bacterium]
MTTSDHIRPADAVERIRTDGFVVLDGVVPSVLVEQLVDTIDRTLDRLDTPFGTNDFIGRRTRRIYNLLSRDPAFASVPTFDQALGVAEAVLGPDLLLSSLTAIEIHPGETAQPLHADDASIPVPRPHDPLALVAIWALTDFTEENGGTLVVPRSHDADRRPTRADAPSAVPTEMPAGSILIYNGSLWHGGGANDSQHRRMGIVCNYCAGWLRQEENQLLGVGRDQVAEFPARLRRLVGYGTFRGLHGHVAGEDPASWFDPAAGKPMVWDRIK